MRLKVDIFKHSRGDCTNKGITSFNDRALLIWDESIEDICKNKPIDPCVLILITSPGKNHKAIPFDEFIHMNNHNCNSRGMFGGNFIYSSDSRFPLDNPIHVHDRFEHTYQKFD